MQVSLTAHDGFLWITPVVPELEPALRFWIQEQKLTKFEYRDHRSGEWREGMRRDGYEGKWENLFSISEDGSYMITHIGLYRKVDSFLKAYGFLVSYRSTMKLPEFRFGPWEVEGLYPEQVNAVIAVLSATGCGQLGWQSGVGIKPSPGCHGALVDSTMGTGKTHTIKALIKCFRDHKIVVTTYRSAVVERLYEGLKEMLEGTGITVGLYYGKAKKVKAQVTVCTDALLEEMDPDETKLILYDEVHNAPGEGKSGVLMSFVNSVKIGFSGSIEKHRKLMVIESMFGPIVFKFTDEEAEAAGRVTPVKVYCLSVPKGPNLLDVVTEHTLERRGITLNQFRNELIKAVAAKCPEEFQLAIFVRTIDHINHLLAAYLPPGYSTYHGDMSEGEKKVAQKGLLSGEVKRMVANDSLGEGVDTTRMRVVIDASWETSDQKVSQKGGRNRRKDEDKHIGIVIAFEDEWQDLLRKKKIKEIMAGCEPSPELLEEDPFRRRARARIKHYRDRKWTVIRNASIDDIDFGEISRGGKPAAEQLSLQME